MPQMRQRDSLSPCQRHKKILRKQGYKEDIDTDFADRDFIIQYITEKYGEERVCQIINFSYITPCVAIKDVGRVLGIPYAVCDKISKKFVLDSFEECVKNAPELKEEYTAYPELFSIASKISGRVRNVSIHAGGVGIVDTKITDYMAMKLGSKGEHVIQVDKKNVEDIGIIKFDLLGVSTLSVVQEVMEDTGLTAWDLNINNPVFAGDEKAYALLQRADTNGVFQVESQGMKDLLLRLHPTSLEDLSAILALYRPDTMSMLNDYIYYKHHEDEVKYWHPDMEPLLKKTYGCIIYQEEIMDIVRVMGHRTYGGADKFRKGISKKDQAMVAAESAKLYKEICRSYPEPLAKKISDYMAQMGSYSFNKSHSALYAILTLKTAYLKAHYPAYFFKALLNQNRGDYGTMNKYILDARRFGVAVLPPSINHSKRLFSVKDGKILFGLEAIKGIGEKVVDQILEERSNAPFTGMENFVERVSPSVSVMVALIKSGAIPCTNKRDMLFKYAQSLYTMKPFTPLATLPTKAVLAEKYGISAEKFATKEERLKEYNDVRRAEYLLAKARTQRKNLADFEEKYMADEPFWEFETLSIFLRNNPFEKAMDAIQRTLQDTEPGQLATVVGIVSNVQKKKNRRGEAFCFFNLYSLNGIVEFACWSKKFKQYESLIKRGSQLAVLAEAGDTPIVVSMKPYKTWLKDRSLNL